MNNYIDVLRMIELEEMIKNNEYGELNDYDIEYLKRANRMPFDLMIGAIAYQKGNLFKINKYEYLTSLLVYFRTNEDDLKKRIKEIKMILKYYDIKNNNLLKEQKRMIKRLNSY